MPTAAFVPMCPPSYPVRVDFENLAEVEIRQRGLYRNLTYKLDLIDRSSNTPVLVEYASSSFQDSWRADDHIGSFLKVVQLVQKQHSGPVVVVSTSPPFKLGDSPAQDLGRKARSVRLATTLDCLGRALGVFLWIAGVQGREGEYQPEGSRWLPLFTNSGHPTTGSCLRR